MPDMTDNIKDFITYSHRTRAEIDIDKIRKNTSVIKSLLPAGCDLIGVVKADAYGHGAVTVSRALDKTVKYFAVSSLHEALQLRSH